MASSTNDTRHHQILEVYDNHSIILFHPKRLADENPTAPIDRYYRRPVDKKWLVLAYYLPEGDEKVLRSIQSQGLKSLSRLVEEGNATPETERRWYHQKSALDRDMDPTLIYFRPYLEYIQPRKPAILIAHGIGGYRLDDPHDGSPDNIERLEEPCWIS
ncbi:hypothetical protein B7494_g6376 [Chlorociboria aeruginascens]|nr:hypothetical protein B7494_g6376 [Chlorociboria aeruginascens]